MLLLSQEKLDIINDVDPTPNVPFSKTEEELSITVSVLNTGVSNQGTVFKEAVSKQLSQK